MATIEFSVTKLGNPNLELKKEQYDAIRAICLEKRDVLTVLPTGFGKSLCYQALPEIFDFMQSKCAQKDSIVIAVSPLNALIRDQLQKLKGCVNICVLHFMIKGEKFQRCVRAIVIDEAHLVLQWYLYILFQKLF